MKQIISFLSILLLTFYFISFSDVGQKHMPIGDQLSGRGDNRLISVQTSLGDKIFQTQYKPQDILDINIDGKMEESFWSVSEVIKTFYTTDRSRDNGVEVNVISDKEYIYLFWNVECSSPLSSNIVLNDSALVGDDYVQVNLKPIIPGSVKYVGDYLFSIAVNPNGALWDAYLDPYDGGYFFTSWDSKTKLKAVKNGNNYLIEMAIPFSDLDVYSDPGWKWNLTFNRAKGSQNIISSSSSGVSVVQTKKVRHASVLGYYWTRPEFWQDVIPNLKDIEKPQTKAVKLNKRPRINKKLDDAVWSDTEEVSLSYDNKMAFLIEEKTAKARVGYDKNNLYLLLKSPNPYPSEKIAGEDKKLGRGMGHQLKSLDGVYRDLSIETRESFWIILQPSSKNGDAPHQDFYFINVDFMGQVQGIKYDLNEKPDNRWRPRIKADVFKLSDNWGIELIIPLKELNISYDCGSVWRMNVLYNLPLKEGTAAEGLSKIQAWYPTLKDEKNPDKTGKITSLNINYDSYIKNTFKRKMNGISDKISDLKRITKSEIKSFQKELSTIKKRIKSEDLIIIKDKLDLLDIKIGIAEEKSLYINSLNLPKDGYPLTDVDFVSHTKGFAVGAMGTVLHTSDGGKTWMKQKTYTDANLSEVFFINENEGWIAGGRTRSAETNKMMRHDERGGDGIILHTKNGGADWEIQYGKRGTYLYGIYFIDKRNGWAVGERGILLRTSDGGKLWSLFPTTDTIKWLNRIYFFDKLNGFIVGESETALKTDDGGLTWKKVNAEADRKFYDFRSFYRDITFVGNKGWIVGQNGTILATEDKGITWTPQATEFDEKVRELIDLKKVFFIDENNGFAVGGLGTVIMKTYDGGKSWSLCKIPNNDYLNGVWFDKNGKGFVVGKRSKILATRDNGKSWVIVNGNNDKRNNE